MLPVSSVVTMKRLFCLNWFCSLFTLPSFTDTAMQITVCVTRLFDSVQKRINSLSKLIPIPNSDVIFSVDAKLNIPLWLIHHLLLVLWYSYLQCKITNRCYPPLPPPPPPPPHPNILPPHTRPSYFQRVWVLIWRCQESSFHSKHIKDSGGRICVLLGAYYSNGQTCFS